MANRYVGIGGNNANSGLTWALRKLTLSGVEDTPVVAADIVYVGPGVYREQLTVDVSGTSGNIITYIADVTGEHTDGVGGIVRITGSDNDQSFARDYGVYASTKGYRTFRGFRLDCADQQGIRGDSCDYWVIEDCTFADLDNDSIQFRDDTTNITIKRCFCHGKGVNFYSGNDRTNATLLIENCLFVGISETLAAVRLERFGGVTVRNCTVFGGYEGVRALNFPSGGTAITVENSTFSNCRYALYAGATGQIVEDYNTFFQNSTDRTNTDVGANSLTYPSLPELPILHSGASQASGFMFPWNFGQLSEWSQVRAITGNSEPSVDLLGIARPATASKNSWGAMQFHDMERETTTTRGGSTASIKLADAGRHQTWVPVANESTTISVYVYREANYAGTNPQMIVKQPGQADDTTTDAAAVSQWNQLTTTLTPAANPSYVIVELASNNTAAAGSYDVFFDDLVVS